jgi:hypothetical protein
MWKRVIRMENRETLPSTTNETDITTTDTALREWDTYQEITQKILNETDYQTIGRTKFKKKSAWRKYMKAFKISTRVIEKKIIKDDKGRVLEADFLVRAWAPNGTEAEGYGNCSHQERRFTKPNHDIPATAMTRAVNRAVSDIIGAGEVSAEEMEGETHTSTPAQEAPERRMKIKKTAPATHPQKQEPEYIPPEKETKNKSEMPKPKRVVSGQAHDWSQLTNDHPGIAMIIAALKDQDHEINEHNVLRQSEDWLSESDGWDIEDHKKVRKALDHQIK